MQMYQLIEWFQLNYPKIQKEMARCNHNENKNSLNPYHLETDCWSHTMLVCKIAEISNYHKVVLIAALLHDIGKPKARRVNPKNNHVQFFGHEKLSARYSKDILSHMCKDKMITNRELDEIKELILNHSLFHQEVSELKLIDNFKDKKQLYIHLVQLSRCDSLGRFCADKGFSDTQYKQYISYSKNMDNQLGNLK